ncbi:MAG: hypothetical protein M3N46_08065, partial [Actinomycetota bacterium]|nr:hypothetical protein [Actinomycetota bacterium]
MTDDTDDLDEFARMFGAKPETPPEGLIPPVPAQPTPSVQANPGGAAGQPPAPVDPLAWLVTPTPPADVPIVDAPTTAFAADLPTAPMDESNAPPAASPAPLSEAFPPAPIVDPFGVGQTTLLPSTAGAPPAGPVIPSVTTSYPDAAAFFPPAAL